ncbi:MAG: hypothetical protein V4478_02215 [Patescibacteria group bacterium]
MPKRIITIILILLAVFALLLGGIWLVGRRQATKEGKAPATFREFLGLSTKKDPATNADGTTTSVFTNPNDTTTGTLDDIGIGNGGELGTSNFGNDSIIPASEFTQTSEFTGAGTSPIEPTSFGSNGSFGTAGNISSAGNTNNDPLNPGTPSSVDGTTTAPNGAVLPSCSAADINIAFTDTELAELKRLQSRYNAIASRLAGTETIANEAALYDDYALEENRVIEMQNFCQSTAPLIADATMQRRVPTPFWNNGTAGSGGYTAPVGKSPNPLINNILEQLLRINLW